MAQLSCASNRLADWQCDARLDRGARVRATRDAIDRLEPDVHALVPGSVDLDAIDRWQSGSTDARVGSQPFAGAPVAIKEIIAVAGFGRRAGSLLPPEAFAADEASIVRRLRALGCIPFAHSVSTEFAYFYPGATCNPRDTDHTPGGSSSGSAAAVAAGLCPLAVGTQTIGSVIRPASYCGIVGYKPTWGELVRDGVYPFSRTVDHLGFFTQDLAGMEKLAHALGLFDSVTDEVIDYRLCVGPYAEQASPAMTSALAGLSEALKGQGARVTDERTFADIDTVNTHHHRIVARDFYHAHASLFEQYGDRYRPQSRELVEEGREVAVTDYEASLDARERAIADFDALSLAGTRPIVWLSPAAPAAAPAGLKSTGSPVMNLPWTHVGAPAATVPMADDADTGLPLGVQICAPRGRDDLVFAAARAVAAACERTGRV